MKACCTPFLLGLSLLPTAVLIDRAAMAQDRSQHYLEIFDAKTHVPAGGAKGNKSARLTARVTITNGLAGAVNPA
jgi:hypothetical protein